MEELVGITGIDITCQKEHGEAGGSHSAAAPLIRFVLEFDDSME